MILLGIDPGLRHMGWAALDVDADSVSLIEAGVLLTTKRTGKANVYQADDDSRCIELLSRGLSDVMRRHRPVVVALEVPAGGKGARAIKSMAFGQAVTVLATLAETGTLPLCVQIGDGKRAATGKASASKEDVGEGVRAQLGAGLVEAALAAVPAKKREHALDAMSVALAALDSDVVRVARRIG